MKAQLNIRDIPFRFKESCNCCNCYGNVKEDLKMRVYVNTQGEIEEYRTEKENGSPRIAHNRSMANLLKAMEIKAVTYEKNFNELQNKVFTELEKIRKENIVTYETIEKINRLMINYFQR